MDTLPASWSEAKKLEAGRYFTGKPCMNGHVAQRYTSNHNCVECAKIHSLSKESVKRVKKWYAGLSDRERMLTWAKYRHKRYSDKPFDLVENDIEWPSRCPALGVELIYSSGNRTEPNRATLDRTDPSRGYEKGNVAVISRKANLIKNDGNSIEISSVARWLRELEDKEVNHSER